MEIIVSMNDAIGRDEVVNLYIANGWSSAHKPEQLLGALRHSHSLVRTEPMWIYAGNEH